MVRPQQFFLIATNLCLVMISHVVLGQISITTVDSPYSQNYNSMASSGTSSSLPAGWVLHETGGAADAFYTANNGGATIEDTYSYGTTSAPDRAFGQLNGILTSLIGASFTNNTGSTITSILVQYYGEQWRLGATGHVDRLDFQYSTNATTINTGTWTDYNPLDFTAPITTGTIGALDGNLASNRTLVGSLLTGLSISNGATFWIRWSPVNAIGNDDGLAVDDFILSANPLLHYQISTAGSNLTVTELDGAGRTLNITEEGTDINFYAPGKTYSLNSGATTPLPFKTDIAALNSITCSAGAGADTISIYSFATTMKDLTLNGGTGDDVINLNGVMTFVTNEFLNVDLQNDDASPGIDQVNLGATLDYNLSGTGSVTIKASRNINFVGGAALQTVNGSITLEANQQTTPATGSFQGIALNNNATIQVSGTGNLTIKGKGGNSGTNQSGIYMIGGDITGSSSGTTTLVGIGGPSTGNNNYGVYIANSSTSIVSTGGDIDITGTGGGGTGSQSNIGVLVSAGDVATAGAGDIIITGFGGGAATLGSNDGVRVITAGTVESTNGNITINGTAGGTGSSSSNVGINVSTNGIIRSMGAGHINLTGSGGSATGVNQFGFQMGGGSSLSTGGGNIIIDGFGGDNATGNSAHGVYMVGGSINAGGSGTVFINGEGGAGTGNTNYGFYMQAATAFIISSGGSVTIVGTGGGSANSNHNYGVYVLNGSIITAGGTGTVSVTGTGGGATGSNQYGVFVSGSNSLITSNGGQTIVTGTGGGTGATSANNYGVYLLAQGTIAAGGSGTVSVNGTGGTGTGTNNVGVNLMNADSRVSSSGGDIAITGNEGNGPSGYGISISALSEVTTLANGGDITLKANSMILNSAITTGANDSVRITPFDDFACLLGPTADIMGGPLHLSDTELDSIFTDHLVIGSVTAGQVFVSDTITRTSATNVYLRSVEEIEIDGGYIHTSGGNLVLDPGTSSTGAYPDQAGTDAIIGSVSCAGKLHFVINGLVADTEFEQLNITGGVNLNGCTLVTSGTHTPVPGQSFIIINNDGADPVTGTFAGLSEGSYVTSFLGSAYPAQITYVGGSGNDVVLSVGNPNYIITTAGNNLIVTDMSGNPDALSVTQSGANIRFSITGRTFSVNGGAITNFPADVAIAGLSSITVNSAGGNDQNSFFTFATSLPSLTVNGGIGDDNLNINGDITMVTNANVDFNHQDDDATPGTDAIFFNSNANLTLSGSGAAVVKVSRNIVFNNGSGIVTANGNLEIETNQQPTSSSGTFDGIICTGCFISVTGTGLLNLKGKGGNSSAGNDGISITTGGDIIGGTTGTATIIATGGQGGTFSNYGLSLQGVGSTISTIGANLDISGSGGSIGAGNLGISIGSSSAVSAGGTGNLSITGTGGPVGGSGWGVSIGLSTITTNTGNISIIGSSIFSTTGTQNFGAYIHSGALVQPGGMGTLYIEGTGGPSPSNDNFGVYIVTGGTSITSSGGDVTVVGYGGGTGNSNNNYGVHLQVICSISAGGNGNVSVTGTGGFTNGNNNIGVRVFDEGAVITSSGGNVTVTGTGGGTAGESHGGVQVRGGGLITAGGLGNVTVNGTGGLTQGIGNYGVMVHEDTATITSSGGNVTVTGLGGGLSSSFFNYGVLVSFTGVITASGSGDVIVNGTGGTQGGLNIGVYVSGSGSQIYNDAGDITISAVGVGDLVGSPSYGLHVNGGGTIFTSGSGNISINASAGSSAATDQHGIYLWGPNTSVHTVNGNIFLEGVGGPNGTGTAKGIYLQDAEVKSTGSGNITIESTGGLGPGVGNHGLHLWDASITVHDGALQVNTTGGGSGSSSQNIGLYLELESLISSNGIGPVTIVSDAGNTTGGSNTGVFLNGPSNGILTLSGDIDITAAGHGSGNSPSNHGMLIQSGSQILAGGNGDITIQSTGGQGTISGHHGLFLNGTETLIASLHGNIDVTGVGGESGPSGFNHGIYLLAGSRILSAGNGNVVVEGSGGGEAGADFNHGVLVSGGNASISSSDGNLTITGFGGGSGSTSDFNYGVFLFDDGIISCDDGSLLLVQGTGGAGTGFGNVGVGMTTGQNRILSGSPVIINGIEGGGPTSFGLFFDADAVISTDSFGGNITLVANSFMSIGTIETPDSNIVTIRPHTTGHTIYVGGITELAGGSLNVSDVELDHIRTGHLKIGSAQTDSILVVSDITRIDTLDITLLAGGHIVLDTGAIVMNGGNLLLDCGNSPSAIWPLTYETEVVTDTLSFGSDLAFVIDSTVADTTYTQLNVIGAVNLNGVDLIVSGTHTPQSGETFTIIENDGTDPVIGTFTGLPQGGSLPSFLGTNLPATISYTGGTGNDVVLTVMAPDYIITTAGNHLIITDVAGNGETLTVSQSGANIRFSATGRNFSLNGGALTSMPADVAIAGLDSITINTNGGNDLLSINSFSTSLPSLTLNGGVGDDNINFLGDINFVANASLDADLQNDDVVPGTDQISFSTNANLLLSGNGNAGLIVSRSINFNSGSSLEVVNGSLTVEANQQTVPSAGPFNGVSLAANSLVRASGTGVLTVRGKGGTQGGNQNGILLNAGDLIGGTAGTTIIEGYGGATTANTNIGVSLTGAGASITTLGSHLDLIGIGGGSGTTLVNIGVSVGANTQISAGLMGNITIAATGGISSGSGNEGLRITGAGSQITSAGGNVSITANGGNIGSNALGISMGTSSLISAGGMGSVSITGTGGNAASIQQHGIQMAGNSMITSAGGNVQVTGHGGGGTGSIQDYGVNISSGTITAGGAGNVSVIGIGGAGSGSWNYGVYLSSVTSFITSGGGNVTVEGTGGGILASANNHGVHISAGSITAGGSGIVHVIGSGGISTGMQNNGVLITGASSSILSSGGEIFVEGTGGGSGTSGNNYGVCVESDAIIQPGGSGNVSVTGLGGTTQGNLNHGVLVRSSNASIFSSGGDVLITGLGGGTNVETSNSHYGVSIQNSGKVGATGNGIVSVIGTGGPVVGSFNLGVAVFNTGSSISSTGGHITITGTGGGFGTSDSNKGIFLGNAGQVFSLADADISIHGTGGNCTGNSNHGVEISGASAISSAGGDINLTGIGMGTGASASNKGVYASGSGQISTTGSGEINIVGTGGATSGSDNGGIELSGTTCSAANGNIYFSGQGGGAASSSNNYGIYGNMTSISCSGSGDVVMTGTGGAATGFSNLGVYIQGAGANVTSAGGNIFMTGIEGGGNTAYGLNWNDLVDVTTSPAGGNIYLKSNTFQFYGVPRIETSMADSIFIAPYSTNTNIRLGDASAEVIGGPLRLTDQEMDSLYTGTLILGSVTTGTISTEADMTRTLLTDIVLRSGDDVIIDSGFINTNGGNLLLDPGASPAAVKAPKYQSDLLVGTLSFGSDLQFEINGTVADTSYEQLNVNGMINLTGVDLKLSGGYIPMFGDTFMIINNDLADAITGTFVGLAEGATIPMFLGTSLPTSITYAGGDGNDVVIRIAKPHYLITDTDGHLEITDLAGNGDALTVSEMGSNIRFDAPGRNFSYNFGTITSLPADISLSNIDSITINTDNGNDLILLQAFTQQLPGLIINGGSGNDVISFNGDITFQADADLYLDLQDDAPSPGTDQVNVSNNTNLILSGQGDVVMKISRNITFNPGSSVQTVNGDILIEANNQMVPTAENFSGISVLNATVEITGDGQMSMNGKAGATTGSNNGIRVDSGGDIIAGISGQMVLTGTGGNSNIGNAHGISLNGPGSTITSHGADVDLIGFGGGSASGDINCGVDVNLSALISAGGEGLVIVNGTGGNSAGSNNNGVRLISGGTITSSGNNVTITGLGKGTSNASSSSGVVMLLGGIITAANNGIVSVTGTGGIGTGNSNHGVFVSGAGSVIQSSGGNVFVTGSGGGTGTSTVNMGVSVASGGKISPGGMGNLEIDATGGIVDGSTNYGVNISQTGSVITSEGGNVSVLAHGGGINASGFNYGMAVQSGTLSAGGFGNVIVEAYGGTSSGGANHGVFVRNPLSIITSAGGNVNVSGFGMGTGQANVGVVLENEGIITASDLGEVHVTGTSSSTGSHLNRGIFISGLNTKITSGGGHVTVVGQGAGAGTSGSSNGLMLVSQGMITAGGTGNVSVTGTGGGGTGSTNTGISIQNSNTTITSSGGNVVVTGQGGGTSTSSSNHGIEMLSGSIITAGANGNVDVTGTGGLTSGSLNTGIFLTAANTRITSGGGDVNVAGQGGGSGNSGSNYGIYLFNAPKILAGGNGDVSVTGQGGLSSGSNNPGVYLTGYGSQITSTNGNVTVSGIGGGSMSSSTNYGVLIDASASIAGAGAGNTFVTGQGGLTSGNSNSGVFVANSNAMIGSDEGDVTITGNGGGNGSSGLNFGVIISSQGIVNANGSGNIIMSGTGGTSSGASNIGLALSGTGATVQSEAGDITMTGQEGGGPTGIGFLISVGAMLSSDSGSIKVFANTMDLFGSIQTSSMDSTLLVPYNTGVVVELNNSANIIGGPLRLSDTKMDMISTGVLVIGDAACDNISIGIPITRSAATDVILTTGGDVIFDPGTINTNGGNLLLDPGTSPMAVKPITSGMDVTADTISFGSDLAFVLNGTVVDAQYNQFNVIGVVNLTGVSLVLSGSYVPVEGDSFVLINNDDIDMIIDTFTGLGEGDTLLNFFGSPLDAVITYIGGDGNDAVLRIVQPCASPSDVMISATVDTACVGTMITLELASGNLGGATEWHWYSNSCGTTSEGTGTSIMVTPSDTTTYYVRGEGGCVINEDCVSKTIVIHPFPDATIYQEFPDSCYYIDRLFRPESPEIPGATYLWNFGPTAIPTTAIGYGPHIVYYTVPGVKNVELVIHPNADGAQCSDSSTVAFTIYNCPGQIVGDVKSDIGNPISSVNVRLFADVDTNGIADNSTALRSVFTTSLGVFAMASLTPGHYVLVQTQPAGWISFDDIDTSDDNDVVANSDSLDNIIPVTIVPREEDEDNKFVERPAPGTITGVVFQDFDLDQFPDAGEGLNAITVELFKDANTNGVADTIVPFATVITAGNGDYAFTNIPVGHYVLVEIQNPGFTSVKDFDASNDSDVVPNTNMTNDTLPVTVINGETDAHNYFIDVPGCGLEVTNTLDDGPGSFRYALGCAGVGDTIHFHPTLSGMTIDITSDQLMLTTDVVVESMLNPQVILSSQIEGMFHIEAGAAVELRGVTVISGLSQGNTGAAFENHGMLTLHNTTIIRNPLFASGEYLIRNHPGAELTFSGQCYLEKD